MRRWAGTDGGIELTDSTTGTRASASAGGLAALAIWSTTVAIARSMAGSLGVLTGPAMALGAGGVLLLAWEMLHRRGPGGMLRMDRRYLLGCGALFVAYEVCVFGAIGWAPSHDAALVVGLLNYLWPTAMVLLSVPLLGRRARWTLLPGAAVALAGTALAVLGDADMDWSKLAAWRAVGPMILAGAAGLTWGLYSNLVSRWGPRQGAAGAVPLFLLASAAALGLMSLLRREEPVWTATAILELSALAVFQSAAAYALWDKGMRDGNRDVLDPASYFLPVASTAVAAAYLRVPPGWELIAGCALVTAGALICRQSFAGKPAAPAERPRR